MSKRHPYAFATEGIPLDTLNDLDEQEQTQLIHILSRQNTTSNRLYGGLISLLTFLGLLYFLFPVDSGTRHVLRHGGAAMRVLSVFVMGMGSVDVGFAAAEVEQRQMKEQSEIGEDGFGGVVQMGRVGYLVLGVLLASYAWLFVYEWHVWLVPAVLSSMCFLARTTIEEVDPARELGSLRYGYKGA